MRRSQTNNSLFINFPYIYNFQDSRLEIFSHHQPIALTLAL
ncbi:hypothetical protein HanXRQr2_Chr02g0053991 [Helianthus annuus]|uniref:Uncharacterized protein n=1 Tax=Helianthus annuus TaxID=4232 RepID=A0A9K3NYS2_HELAN|nr:hypothetical protein HanXRQr2_Chr02g0053991 [Helianthus annuus]